MHQFQSVSNIFKSEYYWTCTEPKKTLFILSFRSYRNGTGYNRTFYEAIRPLISPAVLFISSTWWGLASPHMIMHKQSRIFFSAVGATFSNIAVCTKKPMISDYFFSMSSVVWLLHKWHQHVQTALILFFIFLFQYK